MDIGSYTLAQIQTLNQGLQNGQIYHAPGTTLSVNDPGSPLSGTSFVLGQDKTFEPGSSGGGGSRAPYLGLVGGVCTQPSTLITAMKQQNWESTKLLTQDGNGLSFDIGNYYTQDNLIASAESTVATPTTIEASVEVPAGSGNVYPFTWGGATRGTIPASGIINPDMVAVAYKKGMYVTFRGFEQNTTGCLYQGQPHSTTDKLEQAASGLTSRIDGLTVTPNTTPGRSRGPLTVLGYCTTESDFIIGDSIHDGKSDKPDRAGAYGFAQKAAARYHGVTNFAKSGHAIGNSLASYTRRAALINLRGTRVFSNFYVNDYATNGTSVAAILAYHETMAALFPGKEYWIVMPPPISASTNGWIDVAGQTISTNNASFAHRQAFCKLLRTSQFTNIRGIIDVEILLDSANSPYSRSGVFGAGPVGSTVTDGAITAATNVFNSATAAFNASHTGQCIAITGAGAAGAMMLAVMTYVSATQVTLASMTNIFGNALNASTTVSGATAYIGVEPWSLDGVHPYMFAYNRVADAIAPRFMA